jgi:electron transport complex protein RnfE
MKPADTIKNGIFHENPTFVQVIGICPVLATTTTAINGAGMGISTTIVLACSNMIISLIRNFVPHQIRIPAYVVVISGFVTVIEFLMKAYTPVLYNSLGLYIPLIVVNCLILARAEVYAARNTPGRALLDVRFWAMAPFYRVLRWKSFCRRVSPVRF